MNHSGRCHRPQIAPVARQAAKKRKAPMAEIGLKPSARPSEAAVRRTSGTTRNAAVQGSERLSPPNVNARPRFRVKPPGINEGPAMVGPKTPMVWSAVPMSPEYSMMPAEVRAAFSHHAGQVMRKVVRRNLVLARDPT